MSEPEEVLIEAAHAAFRRMPGRRRPHPESGPPGLNSLRRRLELFLAALCPGSPPIVPAQAPALPTWLGRTMRRLPAHRIERRPFPSTDGNRLRLPPRIDALAHEGGTLEAYQLLGLGLALRVSRGAPAAAALLPSGLAFDLFGIAEGVAVDRQLATLVPGLRPTLVRVRRIMLEERPRIEKLTPAERWTEVLLRGVLAAEPERPPDEVPVSSTASESRAWAVARARDVRPPAGGYRGVPAVFLWGEILPAPSRGDRVVATDPHGTTSRTPPRRTHALARRPAVREPREGEDDSGTGIAMVPIQDLQESVEDPLGLQRPTDRDDAAKPGDLADSLSELPELRLSSDPGASREVLESEDPPDVRATRARVVASGGGEVYPEWDWRADGYRMPGAIVRTIRPPAGSDSWWREVLRRHAPLVRQTRRRFERLRARPVRLSRQADGAEIDLLAYVEAWGDARAGHATDDRLYEAFPPLRRELALALLVDSSASTDGWVAGRSRIIDVEKEALLVVNEGLEALGDRYAILAFSGESADGVRVAAVKTFGERDGAGVRRAIAGLEPDGYTRIGAAIRKTSAMLLSQAVRHRLLLILSDGKPNDVDEYEGRYGVEDARMAVLEARRDGVSAFCLTVDRECATYVPRIFGPGGYTLLRRVESLPRVLAGILQRLVVR